MLSSKGDVFHVISVLKLARPFLPKHFPEIKFWLQTTPYQPHIALTLGVILNV